VVCSFKICDHEVDKLSAKVVRCTKLNGERDLVERYKALARQHALELCLIRL